MTRAPEEAADRRIAVDDARPSAVEPEAREDIPSLTDENLLASFPEGSCFIAKVDHRTVLVFRDPDLRAQIMRH